MIKYGFEKEYFIQQTDPVTGAKTYVLVPPALPRDDCGWLVEARGQSHGEALKAAFLLLAEERRIVKSLPAGHVLTEDNTIKLDKKFKREATRRFGKGRYPHERGNIYGKDYPASDSWDRAGLHVHFSKHVQVFHESKHVRDVPTMIDFVKIIRKLDEAFSVEIKEAKRLPGLYEFKVHGFEYRSLPAHVDVLKVADFVQKDIAPIIGASHGC